MSERNPEGFGQLPPPAAPQSAEQVTPQSQLLQSNPLSDDRGSTGNPAYAATSMQPAGTDELAPWQPRKNESAFKRGFGVGFGFSVGAGVILTILSVLSLVTGMIMVGTLTAQQDASSTAYTTVWGKRGATNTVRAFDISGTIYATGSASVFASAGTYGYEIAAQIDAMSADDAAGIMLLMDTPGGSINGSKAMSDAIERYQERTGKKVVAFVQGMSASGGVYTMAHVDHIIADYGTLIGSIGVIMGPFEYYNQVTGLTGTILSSGVTTTGGITVDYITAGTGKDFGNPFRAMTDEELATYQAGIDVEYDRFVTHVASGRGISEDRIRDELGAYIFDPDTAIDKGLVDEVLGRDEAFRSAAEIYGVDANDMSIVQPTVSNSWMSLLGIEQRIYGHTAPISADSVLEANPLCASGPAMVAYSGDLSALCGK